MKLIPIDPGEEEPTQHHLSSNKLNPETPNQAHRWTRYYSPSNIREPRWCFYCAQLRRGVTHPETGAHLCAPCGGYQLDPITQRLLLCRHAVRYRFANPDAHRCLKLFKRMQARRSKGGKNSPTQKKGAR